MRAHRKDTHCRRFSDQSIGEVEAVEIQADELRTFEDAKERSMWIFTAIDLSSRLWLSGLVGRRSYRNTRMVLRDLRDRTARPGTALIVSGGFEHYARVVRQVFGATGPYAQVLKTRRNDRVVEVERRHVIGEALSFDEFLGDSEDSTTLNMSFVERLDLTIRQGSAYLARRSLSLARRKDSPTTSSFFGATTTLSVLTEP